MRKRARGISRIKQLNNLEKDLMQKHKGFEKNIVALCDDDFKEGRLSAAGYENIKSQSEYIPYREDIEIIVPQKYSNGFKDTLEFMGARELSYIKKDRSYNAVVALMLLFLGIFWIAVSIVLDHFDIGIVKEIAIIASWVFVWAAVEKWFFERKRLSEKKFSLLQILSAKIIIKDGE